MLVYTLASTFEKDNSRKNLPTGSFTFDKSQSPLVFFNCSYTTAGRSCLGMRFAIESMVFVGAAKRVVGARAKTRERVVVKIIIADVGVVMLCDGEMR